MQVWKLPAWTLIALLGRFAPQRADGSHGVEPLGPPLAFPAFAAPVAAAAAIMIATCFAPAESLAAGPVTFVCAISETIASTNSPDERRQLRQFLRAGRGVYQIWNGVDASWGPNLCDVAACSLSSGLLQLENRYSTDEGGRRITHEEMRTIDLSSGHTTSRMVDSTTELPTAYEVETTTYDTGTCAPSADPAAGGGKGSR